MKIQTFTQGLGSRISAGFLLVAILMIALTFIGLKHMAQVNFQIKNIVENNNVKIELGNIMQNALHQRALSMHSIAVLKDEFLKDDEFIHFKALAVQYLGARKKLESLSLTKDEKDILSEIKKLTEETEPYVEEVIQLGMAFNKREIIFDKIRALAIPKQSLIAKQVEKLVSLQRVQAQSALDNEQLSYQNARSLMLLLGSLATLLAILIAYFVIRHVTKQATLLEHQALHDELTGLANRLLFNDRLKSFILRGQRQDISFSILLIDLDHFKSVNDLHGHSVGDLLLQEVARRLNNHVRKVDTVARLGGDEFVIILESLAEEKIIQFADKLVEVISEPFLLAGNEIKVGISMGIASYPQHGQDCATLVNRADIAMYEAKRNNLSYVCYSDEMKKNNNLNLVSN